VRTCDESPSTRSAVHFLPSFDGLDGIDAQNSVSFLYTCSKHSAGPGSAAVGVPERFAGRSDWLKRCRRGHRPSFVLPTTAASGFRSIDFGARLYASAAPIKAMKDSCQHLSWTAKFPVCTRVKSRRASRLLRTLHPSSQLHLLLIATQHSPGKLQSDNLASLNRWQHTIQVLRSVNIIACIDSNTQCLTTPQSVRAHPEANINHTNQGTLTRSRTTLRLFAHNIEIPGNIPIAHSTFNDFALEVTLFAEEYNRIDSSRGKRHPVCYAVHPRIIPR
jgi:hypothetical protein